MNEENQGVTPESGNNKPQGVNDIKEKLQQALEKFREFEPKTQFIIIAVVVAVGYIMFSGGSKPKPQPVPAVQKTEKKARTNTTDARAVKQEDSSFVEINRERESLRRGFFEQQQRIVSDKLNAIEVKVDKKLSEVKDIQQSIAKQTDKLNQIIENFNGQMKSMEKVNSGTLEEIRKIAEESKNRNIKINNNASRQYGSPQNRGGTKVPVSTKKKPIRQIDLGGGSSRNLKKGQPLLGGIVQTANGASPQQIQNQINLTIKEPPPFIPPLGFVRGTLLNGFDALAGAGTPTPALVRLSGRYKTAMNSTVNLNGCFMLIEFAGDLSTERAFGTPARMTCVYPDQGAVTYSVAGYVVDEKDGIVGIPGIFYEGDPARLAAAMVADFTASVAEIIKSNQQTTTAGGLGGTTQTATTGDRSKAELAGGISGAVGSLRDYLAERASRIVPFIRVDATRDLHIVILEGVELRQQGKAWTLLVSGEKMDAINQQEKQRLQQLQNAQRNQPVRR